MKHVESCPMATRAGEKCSNPHSLSKEGNHWWSGWPGAYCMSCGVSDPREECIGDNACEWEAGIDYPVDDNDE